MAARIDPHSLAIDSNALNGLKRSAQNESPESIRAAAKQFEAVLMNMMLKSMRDTVPQDGPMDSEQSKMFMGMLDQQLSTHLSQKGLGLADVLTKQLSKLRQGTPMPAEPLHATQKGLQQSLLANSAQRTSISDATALNNPSLSNQWQPTTQAPAVTIDHRVSAGNLQSNVPGTVGVAAFLNPLPSPLNPMSDQREGPLPPTSQHDHPPTSAAPELSNKQSATQKLIQAYQALAGYQSQFAEAEPVTFPALSPAQFSQAFAQKATLAATQTVSKTAQFISRMLPHAEAASVMSGIPAKFMVGQAALESGWGKHAITTADGQPSHNLFGIKADAHWKGKVATSVTTEYINGIKHNRVEKFRAYDSYTDAFFDYARLISQQPRYQQAMQNTHDGHAYAHALQRAGYATDPHYGQKLASLIAQIRT